MNAPEGLAEAPTPYRFTWEDVLRMAETGIIEPDAHVELIEGELVQMSPQSVPHRRVAKWLLSTLYSELRGRGWDLEAQAPAVLDMGSAPEPDLYVYRSGLDENEVRGPDIALAIEISVTSLKYDLGHKAELYGRFGVREYWVIDVEGRAVVVHRDPGPNGYASIETVRPPAELSAKAFPDVRVPLADLPSV